MKAEMKFYWKLFRKKCRDTGIVAKVRLSLFLISLCVIISTSVYSYQIGKKSLIDNTLESMVVLEKQRGSSLDDRIEAFQDVSYRILQLKEIAEILKEEGMKQQTGNTKLADVICQQSSLFDYTKAAFLKTPEGRVYKYYKYGEKKIEEREEQTLLDMAAEKVTKTQPVSWTVYQGQVCFIRKIIDENFQEQGIFCSIVTESFLQYVDKNMSYLHDENIIILNEKGELLKRSNEYITEEEIDGLANYRGKDYYTYYTNVKGESSDYLTVVLNTPKNNWTIIELCDEKELLRGVDKIWTAMVRNILVVAVLILAITSLLARNITENVKLLEKGMEQYEKGRFQYRISPKSYDEVGMIGLQMNYMALKISSLIELLQSEQEKKQRLELETLQAQINPHFLYNTLGSLKWAAYREGKKDLAASIDALVNLLRFTIKKSGGMVTIREEIEYIQNFIEIEKMHYGSAFEVRYEINLDENLLVPGFILQPIVENSFIHGLDMTKAGNYIEIRAYQKEKAFYLEVSDNGEGMTEEAIGLLKTGQKPKTGFNRIGLRIVDERLRAIYKEGYQMEIQSKIKYGTTISLKIPMNKGESYEVQNIDRRG